MLSRCGMMGLAMVAFLLVSTAAAELPTIGFAVKGGGHWVEDPRETSRSLQACYEIEIESPAFFLLASSACALVVLRRTITRRMRFFCEGGYGRQRGADQV